MAVVALDHRREELLHRPVMGHGIDLKGLANSDFCLVEDRSKMQYAGIVDKDCWVPMYSANLIGCFM